jgi:hypothetical protein
MKSKVWVLPGAIGVGLDSIWEEPPPGLRHLAGHGEVIALADIDSVSEVVGLSKDIKVPRGPLVVAAFGWEPPRRSVQFQLDLLTVHEDGSVGFADRVSAIEAEVLKQEFSRLATRLLTPKWGEGLIHGLVWEDGSLDLGCAEPKEIIGDLWNSGLPEGDGEVMLRMLIEDSLNLLDGLEFNRRRADDGLPKLNLLWPHSFGFEPDLPNLALRRGNVAQFWSGDIALEGMAKLVGYRHRERSGFYQGVHVSDKVRGGFLQEEGVSVLFDERIGGHLCAKRGDEGRFSVEEWDRFVWEPMALAIRSGEVIDGAILCPGSEGLGLIFGAAPNGVPFDGRGIGDSRLRKFRFGEVMAKLLGA